MRPSTIQLVVLVTCWAVQSGCSSRPEPVNHNLLLRGQYAKALHHIRKQVTDNRTDHRYLLDRMAVAMVTMADGRPRAGQGVFEQVYEVLRTQGINEDKTIESVVLNEDLKFWKGEPFEQALAMLYYGIQQASLGHWDNARAASASSLFNLRQFDSKTRKDRIDADAIAKQARDYERARKDGNNSDPEQEAFNNRGYVVKQSDFTLGYLLGGIANQQLGRDDEAHDHLAVAMQIDPRLQPLLRGIDAGQYNTVLVISWGVGPAKIAHGPDNALAGFEPRTPSTNQDLIVRVGKDERRHHYPVICDVNHMATNHMWNSLESARVAKSGLGTILATAGAVTTAYGVGQDTQTAAWAGLGAILAGVFLKAGAHADTRYCQTLPQRLYLVPLLIERPDTEVQLQVEGIVVSRLRLVGLEPPGPGQPATLRYVRLLGGHGAMDGDEPPAWTISGRIFYDNTATGPAAAEALPYILGGRCVRPPDQAILDDYRKDAHLQETTLAELKELYRAEGISWDSVNGQRHLLEGGRSLGGPQVGTVGFARLYGQVHRPYKPRSKIVQHHRQRLSQQRAVHQTAGKR